MSNQGLTWVSDDPLKVEKAFLVGIEHKNSEALEAEEHLQELADLVTTLGLTIVGSEKVKLRTPRTRLLLGTGKARDVVNMARECGADVLIFDDPLTPSQQRNWEAFADLAVIDRQEVILDIFADRAQTREAVLQVALAKTTYAMPRLRRRWTHLHRQRGAAGGRGMRGEGEQQLEMDSRMVRVRLAQLRRQLAEVRQHRDVQRSKRQRRPLPVAAIVGYTNAGKSSLLNTLTEADVLVENKLFATLDPTVRRLMLPNHQELLLVDTVGFIRKLPHLLVEAFKSTLEETTMADFLIEVIDVTGEHLEEHHRTTREVLADIGAGDKPVVTVLNKIDRIEDALERRRIARKYPDAILISARTGEGLDDMRAALAHELEASLCVEDVLIPHQRYDLVAKLHRTSAILRESYDEDGIRLQVRMSRDMRATLAPYTISSD